MVSHCRVLTAMRRAAPDVGDFITSCIEAWQLQLVAARSREIILRWQ
jgi:hypothetical protein